MNDKRKVTQEELDNICILHNKFIEDEDGGIHAVFENCSFERFPRQFAYTPILLYLLYSVILIIYYITSTGYL